MNPFQDVFISYGRADSKQFAKTLNDRLVALGYTVWFDFEDIPLGVDYQKQIDDGIEKADNFLFIIAPHSVNSAYCGLEVERALARNKRIIPLLHVERISRETWQQRNPSGTDAAWEAYTAAGKHDHFANMHPEIRKINWVYMREGVDDYEVSLQGLVDLLESHKDYVHQHTVLLNSALEWEQNQKRTRYLLIGEERQQAEKWLATRFTESQPPCIPTDLHCEYITESIKNANNLMTQVFLCHAEADREVAEQVRRSLMRSGITTWTHHGDIEFGSDFQAAMVRGMEEADNVVFLLSPRSLTSTYCRQELDHALSLHKRIIPLRAADVDPEAIPESLQTLQYIDLTDNTSDADYQQDISDLLRILKQDEAYHHEHKVLLTKALKWERQQRNPCILLRGYELQHGMAWLKLAQQFPNHSPTPLQREFITESERQPPGTSLDVFISYSRSDSDFARRLNDALQRQGKRTWFDQESIASGTDFQQEIYRGIEASDHFLFVLSPRSVKSPYCADEVEYAAKLNKRIVTVRYRAVEAAELHPELAKVQWVDFLARDRDFAANFQELLRTLDADPEHLRYHTHLLLQAIKWDEKGRRESLLLRGTELAEAEQWLLQAAGKQPSPTALQGEYVSVSRRAKSGQQQRLVAILGSLLVAALLGVGVGFWGWGISKEQTRLAEQEKVNAQIAEAEARKAKDIAEKRRQETAIALQNATKAREAEARQRDLAEQKTQEAESALTQAQLAQIAEAEQRKNAEEARLEADENARLALENAGKASAFAAEANARAKEADARARELFGGKLAAQAEALFKRSEQPLSTLLAIAAIRQLESLGKSTAEANKVLNDFLALPLAQERTFDEGAIQQAASADGKYLATVRADGTVRVWDLETEQTITTARIEGAFGGLLFWSPNSQYVAIGTDTTTLFWDWKANRETRLPQDYTLFFDGFNLTNIFSPDSNYALVQASNSTQTTAFPAGVLWDLKVNKPIPLPSGYRVSPYEIFLSPGSSLFSPDGRYIIVYPDDLVSPQEVAPPVEAKPPALWDLQDIEASKIISLPSGYSYLGGFSPDGQYAIISPDYQTSSLWDLRANTVISLPAEYLYLGGFSHDGQYAIIGSNSQTALWPLAETDTTEITPLLQEPLQNFATFSQDDQYVILPLTDRTVVWDIHTGKAIAQLTPENDFFSSGFSSDNQYIVTHDSGWFYSGGNTNTAQIWRLDSGQEVGRIINANAVGLAQFSSDGRHLITGNGFVAEVWSTQVNQDLKQVLHNANPRQINLSPNGQYLLVSGESNTWAAWELETEQKISQVTLESNLIEFSPRNQYVFIRTFDDNNARSLWDLKADKLISLPTGYDDFLAISPDDRYAVIRDYPNSVTGDFGDRTALWDLKTARLLPLPNGYVKTGTFNPVNLYNPDHQYFSPDGKYAIVSSSDQTALWDLTTDDLTIKKTVPLPGEYSSLGGFSPDGRYAIVSSSDQTALWDLTTDDLTENKPIPLPDGYFSLIYFSPGSKYAVIFDGSQTALWDLVTRKLIALPGGYLSPGNFSPDGKYVTVSSNDSQTALWDLATKKLIALPGGYLSLGNFSPDGKYAIISDGIRTALWDLTTDDLTAKEPIPLPANNFYEGRFSPGSQFLILGSEKGRRLWDLEAQQEVFLPEGGAVEVVFSPNGRYVVFKGKRSSEIWLNDTEELIQRACSRINRNLTVQEWAEYIGRKPEEYEKTCNNLDYPDDHPTKNSPAFSGLQNGFAQVQEALAQPFAKGPVTVVAVSQTGVETQPLEADNPAKNMEPFAEAVRVATQAAELTQVAQTEEEWAQIGVQWDTAMQLMIKVGADHEKYAIAQDRIPTYQTNRDYAFTQAGVLKTTSDLKR